MNKFFTSLLFSFITTLGFAQTVNVTITQNAGQSDPTNTSPVVFKAVFSEAVTGFGDVAGDVITSSTTAPGTIAALVAGSGTTYTISVSGMTGSGNVIITIPASAATATATPAGRMNVASTNTDNTVAYDITSPIAFSTNTFTTTGGTQVPGYWNSTNTGISVVVPIDNDASLTGGTIQLQGRKNAGAFADVGPAYTILVGNLGGNKTMTLTSGQFEGISGGIVDTDVVEIVAVITDNVGNSTTATNSHSSTVDQTSPTVTVNQDPGPPAQTDPTSTLPVRFRAVFNEPINTSSFVNGDVSLTGTASGKSVTGVTQFNPPNDGTTWNISATVTGSGTVIAALAAGVVTDIAGNNNAASTFTDKTITVDITPPTVNSHSIVGGTTSDSGFTYSVNVSEAGTTYWEVTTSATAPTGAQIKAGTGTGHVSLGNFAITASTNTNQPITGLAGSTTYYIYSVTEDALGNQSTPVVSDNTTTLCTPPTTQTSAVNFTLLQAGSVTVNWTRGNGNNVIVVGRQGTATSVTPANGNSYSADVSFGAGDALAVGGNDYFVVYNGSGTSVHVTDLSPSSAYNFKVFEYNTTGVCYNLAETATNSITTPSASTNSTITAGTGIALFPSTTNTSPGVNSFQFTITDAGDDGSDTDITQIIFTAGTGNDVTDWTQVIQGVELVDNAGNGNEDYGTPTIQTGPNRITIPSISNNGDTKLGDINDGAAKIFTLRVWLKTNLGGLKATIDNQNLVFKVDAADISTNNSGILPGQTANSGSTNNSITVTGSQININQQPSTNPTATVALAQQPIFEATDANGNRDLDFNYALAVNTTNPTNLGPASPPSNFVSGVSDFTGSGFNFTNTGTSTMSVTANSITSGNSSSITVSAATTLAGGATGTAPSPLSNGATNKAVLGFSLQTTGSTLNLSSLTVTATSDPDVVFTNIKLISSTDNDFGTSGDNTDHVATVTTPGNTIVLGTFGTPAALSGTIRYFFIVADVNNSFSVSNPTIALSLTTANTNVSVGTTVGTTQTGTTYSFLDTTPPTISSITNNVNPVFEGALTQTVVVKFSESMNATGSFNPAITLSGSNWGAQAAGSWSTTTFPNDTYTTTFTHSATQETIAAATASIAANTAKDLAGNVTSNAPQSSASFLVDNQKPTATVTTSPSQITTNNLNALQVVSTYSESMNPGVNPTINLSGGSFNAVPAGVWSVSNTVYTVTITHDGTAETIASVTATTSGGKDANGNVQVLSPASNAFAIDTQRPTVLSINRQNPSAATPTNNTSVIFRVLFSESVTGVDPADFTKTQSGLSSGAISVTPITGTTYDVTISSISGDGTLRLDLLNTASITDSNGNAYNSNFTTGQVFTIDNTPPLLSILLPADNKFAVPLPSSGASQWKITYNEAVKAGVGNISILRASDDVVIATIPIGGPAIVISGNDVNVTPFNNIPSVALVAGENYYVQIPSGVVQDLANNAYAGFVDKTSWNFQTYSPPTISGVIKSISATSLTACVGETITINGQYFSGYNVPDGIASVTFYDNTGANPITTSSGITVINPTSLTVIVPSASSITTQTQVKLTSKTEVIASLGTNSGALSASFSPMMNLGLSSASIALFTPGAFEVCSSGAIASRDLKVTTTGGNSANYNVVYSITGTIPTGNSSVGSYVSGSGFSVNPPGVGDYDYAIVSVTDQFGCPSPTNTGTATVREYTANSIVLNSTNQPIPVCLANTPNATIALNTTITGSSVAGAIFNRGNGQGGWPATPTKTLGGSAPTNPPTNQTYTTSSTYTFDIQDYALPAGTPLTLTLTTTGSNAVCQEASLPVVVTFATSASGSINSNNPTPLCQAATPTNTTVTLNGTVTGGATSGVWQAFSEAGAATNITSPTNFTGGTYFADISGIAPGFSGPGYQTTASGGAVSILYTYSNFNGGVAHFRLVPTGGTCGTANASTIYTVTANPVPSPAPGANPANVCLGDEKFITVSQTSGSTYQWSNPSGDITIKAGQGTSSILAKFDAVGPKTLEVIETNSAGCQSQPTTISIAVNEEPVPSFTSPNARIFGSKAAPVELKGSGDVANGTTQFSGPGVFINSANQWFFSPASAGVGNNYPIRYTYSTTTTGCSNFKVEQFTVFDGDQSLVQVSNGNNLPDFCADEDEVEIKLNPAIASLMPADYTRSRSVQTGQICLPFPYNICYPTYTTYTDDITYKFTGFSGAGIVANTMGSAILRNTDATSTFDPKLVPSGVTSVDIIYYYQEYITPVSPSSGPTTPNGAPKEFGRQTITINPVPTLFPNFGVVPTTLCSNNTSINLTKNDTNNPGTNFTFFVSPSVAGLYPGIVSGDATSGFTLNPSAYTAATYDASFIDLFYGYEDSNGCNDTTSVAASNTLHLSLTPQPPQPIIDIGTNICITNGAVPVATITNVVSNSVANANTRWFNNINLNPPTLSQNPDFAAPINPSINNTFDFFAVQEINGCISPVTQIGYEVLNVPKFTWNKFCVDGGNTQFDVNLGSVNATDLTWTVLRSDATPETSQTSTGAITGAQSFLYTFNSADRYDVTADVTSINGCVASRTQPVILLDKFTATDTQIYSEDFEGGTGGFISLKDDNSVSNSTWGYGVVNKTTIKNPATNPNNKAWVTNLTGAYNNGERSYLYSGCLDITGLQRPLISFSSWTNTDDKNDGVILQYSVDNKVINDPTKDWNALGNIGTGFNWYNRQLIQSIPGNKPTQNYGWSGDSDKGWKSSKHSLDDVANALLNAGSNTVVFRFAFAATNPAIAKTQDGFALDSLFIGNRTRTILLENFTNKGNVGNASMEKNQSTFLENFNPSGIGTTLVKINYHVGFPNVDPFNLDDPADPSARALYYNVTNTPAARLDGEKPEGGEQPFSQWGEQEYKLRTLQLGQSEIVITPTTNPDGSIDVKIDVTPNTNLPQGTKLHIAILEEKINLSDLPAVMQDKVKTDETSFEYVLKKMLPSAPGFDTGPMNAGANYSFGPFSWYPEPTKLYGQPNNLAVVAFLQNELTKDVYQAELVRGVSDPPVVTGLDDILAAEQIAIYPNPADQELTLQLPNVAPSLIHFQMVDQVGRLVYEGRVEKGEQTKTISTRDLAGGIYLLQLGSGKVSTRKKVMVVHNK